MNESRERVNQKQRTREALLEGARRLIARGEAVTVTAAAEEMAISKATAYRYFKDPAALAAEAGLALEVQPYEAVVAGCAGPRARVIAVSLYMFELSQQHEAQFRQFLARTMDAWATNPAQAPRRGARRMAMFEAALAGALPEPERRALAQALGVGTGIEALIALADIAQASPAEARAAVQTIAEALCDRFGVTG